MTKEMRDRLRGAAERAEGAKFHLEGFEQTHGNGHFYGGLIMHENGETIIAQCVMPTWADHIAQANPAAILSLLDRLDELEQAKEALDWLLAEASQQGVTVEFWRKLDGAQVLKKRSYGVPVKEGTGPTPLDAVLDAMGKEGERI